MNKKEILSQAVQNEGIALAEDVAYEEIPMEMMQRGDFVGLRRVLTGKDRAKYMGLLIESIEKTIESSRKEAVSLKDRGFFGRLASNNVNDIGEVLGKQNIVIACLFLLMQMQSLSIDACNDWLASLYKAVNKTSEDTTAQSSIIAQTFRDVLEDYRKRLEKDSVRDKALMKLLKAAENNKDFEASIREALEKAKSKYSTAVEKLYEINIENQRKLSEQVLTLKRDFDLKISEIEKSHKESIEGLNKRWRYTIYAFSITTIALLSGLIASVII